MKKLLNFVLPLKSFAAMIFSGFICAYMVTGTLYSIILKDPFNYTIPFVFVLQGLVLSIVISSLWVIILGDTIIKKMRYLPRLIIFSISLMVVLVLCLLTFFAIPTDWAKLWLIVAGLVVMGIIALSILFELYYRITGKRYTEMLREYQSKIK